jgi:two-component system, LytTR family, sensor kinase
MKLSSERVGAELAAGAERDGWERDLLANVSEWLQRRSTSSRSREPTGLTADSRTPKISWAKRSGELQDRFPRLQFAAMVFLAWTGVGAFETAPEALISHSIWPLFAAKLIDAWVWALLMPLLMLIDRRFGIRQTSLARVALLFLAISIPFTLVHTYLTAVLLYPIHQVWWNPLRSESYGVYFFLGGWANYCALTGVLLAFRFYNRYLTSELQLERVEKSLLKSRLQALRLHLEPHFLFNALNTISCEIQENPELACDMVENLGALLRRSLDYKDQSQITLAQELSLLEHYLSIQRARFGDRIQIRVDVRRDTLSAFVPSMLLQPLVENAIGHGIERRLSGGIVVISASKRDDALQIEVDDDGIGLPDGWTIESSRGHGLQVTRERLNALYPQAGGECLKIAGRDGGGTRVTVHIPLGTTGGRSLGSLD